MHKQVRKLAGVWVFCEIIGGPLTPAIAGRPGVVEVGFTNGRQGTPYNGNRSLAVGVTLNCERGWTAQPVVVTLTQAETGAGGTDIVPIQCAGHKVWTYSYIDSGVAFDDRYPVSAEAEATACDPSGNSCQSDSATTNIRIR